MMEMAPFRFGIGPPPQPKPPNSWSQSMGQPGVGHPGTATAPGASVAVPGNSPIGALGNPGGNSAALIHPAAVSAPSVYPSPAANGAVPQAMSGPVQGPGVSGMNGYAANTMPVSGMQASGVANAHTAPALATSHPPTSMPGPYAPTAPTTNLSTAENSSPAPIRGGRGIALSEEDKVLLLKICVESQNTLKFVHKTAFWRCVSKRFETIRGGRQYSTVSCERAVTKWTDARRAALKNAGGRRVLSDAQKITILVDQMIDLQDEVEQKAKEKEAEMRELLSSIGGGYYGTSTQTPARTGGQQDETQVSPSIFDRNSPQGSHNSDATSPEIDITDNNITTLATIDDRNNNDDPIDFESTVISELSRIRSLVTHEATVSVATNNFLKKNHQSLNSQLDRLEDKFKEMQRTLDQQTGILSDQNTVLKQILTMMSHGRRSPMIPGLPYQGPPSHGIPPHGAPYYPPGPPYYPYYQGPPFQGPQTQAQPPQPQNNQPQESSNQSQALRPQRSESLGPPAQSTQSQEPQPQASQPQTSQPQGPPSQGTQPQGPPPPQSKFAVFSGWVS